MVKEWSESAGLAPVLDVAQLHEETGQNPSQGDVLYRI